MDKLKFIATTVIVMTVYYLIVVTLMPLVTSTADDAIAEINTSPNAGAYGLSIAGLQYTQLALLFVPAVIAVTLVVLKLKAKI